MPYLEPGVPWSEHSRPEARAALKEAAAAGWHFRKSRGHAFGMIKCAATGQSGACILVIHSTSGPADGSETAKAIRRARGVRVWRLADVDAWLDARLNLGSGRGFPSSKFVAELNEELDAARDNGNWQVAYTLKRSASERPKSARAERHRSWASASRER